MDPKLHWENVYVSKRETEVSWYQPEAHKSLELIRRAAPDTSAAIADVGGGASTLVDGLLGAGYRTITVLDLSAAALDQARKRLGHGAGRVTWREANALDPVLPEAGVDVWHDRAVFHFLTDPADRLRYVAQVRRAVHPGGFIIVATFDENGPDRCSGLKVRQYSSDGLRAELGDDFRLVISEHEDHTTPLGVHQSFQYSLFRYLPLRRPEPAR